MSKRIFTSLQYLSFAIIIYLLILLVYNNFNANLNKSISLNKSNVLNNKIRQNLNENINHNLENNPNHNLENDVVENIINENEYNIDTFRNLNDNIIIESDFRKIDALDKIYNPLEYPYQSPPYYNSRMYLSNVLPPSVMECGSRKTPCYGGSQKVINNNYPIKLVSNNNIAPINIRTRGPEGEPQQVGTLFKLTPGNKDIYPLFGRKKFPNDSKWEYYTIIGDYGAKVPVKPLRNYEEIGTNDIVQLLNYPGNYKATIYKREDLQYIPYV